MSDNTTPCPFDDLCKSEVLAHILRNHPGVFTPGMAALLATAQQDPLVMCLPCSPSVQSVSAAAQHVSAAVHLGAVAVQLASAAPTCSRGDSCYQLTQSHISSCHRGILTDAMTRRAAGHRGPWSSNPSMGSTVKLASAAPTCSYGTSCYRTNPEHVRIFHGGKMPGTR
jgi:hypothetical protein